MSGSLPLRPYECESMGEMSQACLISYSEAMQMQRFPFLLGDIIPLYLLNRCLFIVYPRNKQTEISILAGGRRYIGPHTVSTVTTTIAPTLAHSAAVISLGLRAL